MRTDENRLLHSYMRSCRDRCFAAPTGDVVSAGQMPVSNDEEKRAGDFPGERITRIHAHHEVRREICSPWSRVVQIVFRVERIVTDQAAENSTLNRKAFSNRR